MKKTIFGAGLALAALSAQAQFQQNFDASTNLPSGWSIINQGDANGWAVSSDIVNGAHSGDNAVAIYYDYATAHNDYLITQAITVTAGVNDRISFWVKSRSEYYLEPFEVRLSTTNNTATSAFSTVLQAEQEAPIEWTRQVFDLSNYVGQTVYVAIRATGLNEFELYVDDVISDSVPACASVEGLAVGEVGAYEAEISWTAGNYSTWQYAIGAQNADPNTLTPVDADSSNITIDDLDPATNYSVYVRTTCGEGQFGEWSQAVNFLTACVASAPPVSEDFEGDAGEALPVCWSAMVLSGENNWIGVENPGGDISTTVSGTRIAMKNYYTSDAVMYSLPLDFSNVNQAMRVNLFLHRHASAAAGDKYQIYVNTSASLTGAVQILEQFSLTTAAPAVPATGFYNYKINIPESFNGAAQVFVIVRGVTEAGYSSYALGVDDFSIEPVPTCAETGALSTSNLGSSTVTLNWVASASNPANGYEYAIGTTNDVTAATISGTTAAGVVTADVDGLTPVTTYFAWVRSVCSEADQSPWSLVATFTTNCVAIAESALPWNEGFEGLSQTGEGVFPPCWSNESGDWSTSENAYSEYDSDAHAGTQFLRVAWSAENDAIWTPGFALTAGTTYDFSFWFASYGEYDSWSAAVFVNSDQVSNGATQLGQPFLNTGTVAPNTYGNVVRSFTPQTDGTYYFSVRVNETTGSPWYLSFDDFNLNDSELSVGDHQTSAFAFYPNPVKDRLNITSESQLSRISVYNLMGQQVSSIKVEGNQTNIDMSALSAGVYLVKAEAGAQVKTIRVIKQ